MWIFELFFDKLTRILADIWLTPSHLPCQCGLWMSPKANKHNPINLGDKIDGIEYSLQIR